MNGQRIGGELGQFIARRIRRSGWCLLALLAVIVLPGCADDGAGGFTVLDGTWQGTFQEGAFSPAGDNQPLAHAPSGTMTFTFAVDNAGNITGTATMNPDICAEGSPEVDNPAVVAITGTLTGNAAEFRYTSTLLVPNQDVVFTVSIVSNPMLGNYDGRACEPTWAGGFKLIKD